MLTATGLVELSFHTDGEERGGGRLRSGSSEALLRRIGFRVRLVPVSQSPPFCTGLGRSVHVAAGRGRCRGGKEETIVWDGLETDDRREV